MKKIASVLGFVFIATALFTMRTSAQAPDTSGSPQTVPTGVVTGILINQSPGGTVPGGLSVMLHILDQNFNQVGMLHTQSLPDGSFRFDQVPLSPDVLFQGIVGYLGATYYSEPVPYDGKNTPNLEVSLYEATADLSSAKVDEMHVIFNFADDGLEMSEIYLLSNLGEYTITGTLTLTDGLPATIEYPLPTNADYVFFKPAEPDRFVRTGKGFADKAALIPGAQTSNFMVSYLLPYSNDRSYSYTAPVGITKIDFLLPEAQGVHLNGSNLEAAQVVTFQDSSVYDVYGYGELSEGQSIKVNFIGDPKIQESTTASSAVKPGAHNKNLALEIGSAFVGAMLIGVGVWQWRKARGAGAEDGANDGDPALSFEHLTAEIARLDNAHERSNLDEVDYLQRRKELMANARAILKD